METKQFPNDMRAYFWVMDFRINHGTGIGIALNPLTFILSPEFGGEGRVRGA